MSLFLQSCSIVFPLLKCYIVISLLSSRFCSNKIYNAALCSAPARFSFCPFYIATWTMELGDISRIIPNINQNLRNYGVENAHLCSFFIIYRCAKIFELVNRRWCNVFQSDVLRPTAEEEGEGRLDTWWHFVAVCHLIWHLCLFSAPVRGFPCLSLLLFSGPESGRKHLRYTTNVIIYS